MIFVIGALVGFFASFISTLLGGGAGLIAVPAFYYVILHNFSSEYAMQIALATCCGMSIFLGAVAVYKHLKNKTIQFDKNIIIYLFCFLIGVIIGSLLIKHLDTAIIKKIFVVLLFGSGLWMLFHKDGKLLKMPKFIEYSVLSICGVFSILLTSSTFATIFFVKVGMTMKKAISLTSFYVLICATASSFILVYGVNIDIPNTFGYMSIPLLLSSAPFAIIGSLVAVKFLGILSNRVLHILFITLMFASAIVMCF